MNNRLLAVLCMAVIALPGNAESVWVGRFNGAGPAIPAPWKIEQVNERVAPTRYSLREWDGIPAIEAQAKASMALLTRPLTIDLQKTPILCWQWRIDAPLASADMTKKSGDDYAARVYLVFDIPAEQLSLATRVKLDLARRVYGGTLPDAALNYVWDNRHAVGTWQDNAYTDRARMLVVRSGASMAGPWVSERRNVLSDFQHAFGPLDGRLSGLAIASDTDNTGEEAHAGFADFRFVEMDRECPEPSKDK